MKFFSHVVLALIIFCCSPAHAEENYRKLSLDALEKLKTVREVPFKKTTHPGAQWFPEATFGLFHHWGIHSVAGLDASHTMRKGISWYTGENSEKYQGRENYYALAKQFNPQKYDPEKWVKAAKEAGMTYAVLTAKHHDGYAIWPSEYGEMGTKQYMNGRDLLRPYVEACRKYGLKVGFYFSGSDWFYPGYPMSLDPEKKYVTPPGVKPFDNEEFAKYVTGQLSELLTRYGKIDIIWFDGGVTNYDHTCAWIRELQPHIIIGRGGDLDRSFESGHKPTSPPDGWWEHCMYLGGHWGHAPAIEIEPTVVIMDKLVVTRAWGGNFLMNLGPRPDGTMRPEFYERMADLAAWMEHSSESLIGAGGVKNWQNFSATPITRRENKWYLHVLPTLFGPIQMYDISEAPTSVTLLRTGEALRYRYYSNRVVIDLPYSKRQGLDEVIVVTWDKEPKPTRERY